MTQRKKSGAIKFCIVCGKRIPDMSSRHKICTERCARKRRNLSRNGQAAPFEFAKEPPIEAYSLGEIQRRASAAGMSYGAFMSSVHNGGISFEGIKASNR